ncbi:MAG: hypothetical protein IJD40_04250 [Lachnospiraceae bacterium]|nr:hypothetical protein [Lachnospiraceae bacterium]
MRLKEEAQLTPEQNTQEEKAYLARKESITESLTLTLDSYVSQFNNIPSRINKRKTEMIVAIIVFTIITVIDGFLTFLLSTPEGVVLVLAWEIWAACIFLYIASWKLGFKMVEKIFEFNIQNETLSFQKYKEKYNVYTLRDEQRYCKDKINETKTKISELSNLQYPASLAVYADYSYMEKRADTYTFDWFRDNQILCYIIMGVLFVIFIN